MQRKPEIMSPAGYWPQLQAAVEAGADRGCAVVRAAAGLGQLGEQRGFGEEIGEELFV